MRGEKDGTVRKRPRLAAAVEKSKLSVVAPPALVADSPLAGGPPVWQPSAAPVYAANRDAPSVPVPSVQVRGICHTFAL